MSDRDFFREVDEAVRHDNTRSFGTATASMPSSAPALIVAGVAGFKAWIYWQTAKPQAAGTGFTQALGARQRRRSQGGGRFTDWRRRVRLAIACWRVSSSPAPRRKTGDTDKAVALYDALAADSGTDTF